VRASMANRVRQPAPAEAALTKGEIADQIEQAEVEANRLGQGKRRVSGGRRENAKAACPCRSVRPPPRLAPPRRSAPAPPRPRTAGETGRCSR
jgi:hypothetical protein